MNNVIHITISIVAIFAAKSLTRVEKYEKDPVTKMSYPTTRVWNDDTLSNWVLTDSLFRNDGGLKGVRLFIDATVYLYSEFNSKTGAIDETQINFLMDSTAIACFYNSDSEVNYLSWAKRNFFRYGTIDKFYARLPGFRGSQGLYLTNEERGFISLSFNKNGLFKDVLYMNNSLDTLGWFLSFNVDGSIGELSRFGVYHGENLRNGFSRSYYEGGQLKECGRYLIRDGASQKVGRWRYFNETGEMTEKKHRWPTSDEK